MPEQAAVNTRIDMRIIYRRKRVDERTVIPNPDFDNDVDAAVQEGYELFADNPLWVGYRKRVPVYNATVAATKLAEQHGIDIAQVTGTGTGGKVTKRDVEDFLGTQVIENDK